MTKIKPLTIFAIIVGILCLLGAVLLGISWLRCPNGACPQPTPTTTPLAISNFSDCAAAGNPVAESYPRQCRILDGKTFIEEIGPTASVEDLIYVDNPQPEAVVKSPLLVTGAARGNWYFEASFPVRLLDGNGKEVVVQPAQAQGEWMTTEFVPFSVKLTFTAPTTTAGTLVLEKDNPSGLPQYAAELRIPIRFR